MDTLWHGAALVLYLLGHRFSTLGWYPPVRNAPNHLVDEVLYSSLDCTIVLLHTVSLGSQTRGPG
jgi:hypothetical protein